MFKLFKPAQPLPLPEVSEVDWSQWEDSVLDSSIESLALSEQTYQNVPASGPAPTLGSRAAPLPILEAVEVDWSVWEESLAEAR